MSHFIGLVFVDPSWNDLDTMLEPYNEQTEDPAFLEFVDTTDEIKEAYDKLPDTTPLMGKFTEMLDETDLINRIWNEAPDELNEEDEDKLWKPYTKKEYPTPSDIARDKGFKIVPDESKEGGFRFEREVERDWRYEPSKEKYPTIDEFAKNYYGYQKKGGKYGYTHNPCAKWDWYSVGGRWGGYLTNKDVNKTDCDLITEIDWEKQEVPFCFVTTGSEWCEKGQMLWWAMTANEKKGADWNTEFKAYVQSLLADAYDENGNPYEDGVEVYAVDFHI